MTGVLGYLMQCGVCPQQAIVEQQIDGDWLCPRCALAGFGDVDVAQGEPLAEMDAADERVAPKLQQRTSVPLTLPVDDPLAVAICAEVDRHPSNPLITAVVDGKRFVLRSFTHRDDQPFATQWFGDLHSMSKLPSTFDEPAYFADDGPDLGKIRG